MDGDAVRHRPPRRPVLAVGLGLQAAGLAWLALVADSAISFTSMVPPLVVAGIGTSAALPVSQAAIVGSVAGGEIGKAAGANNMLQELGGAFGIAVAVAVFSATGSYSSPDEFADGFVAAVGVAAGLAAIGFLASLALPRPTPPPTGGDMAHAPPQVVAAR
jgi:MFS family permease